MATQSETLKQSAVEHQLPRLRSIAIVPAHNEEASLGALLAEIRIAEPDLAVVVINDGSTDSTARVAEASGVPVVNLPFNVGIGGTVQTGYQYALEHGYEIAIQVDADGSTIRPRSAACWSQFSRIAPTSSSALASLLAAAIAAHAYAAWEFTFLRAWFR